MKNFRKLLLVFMCFGLVFGLSACGKEEVKNTEAENTETVDEVKDDKELNEKRTIVDAVGREVEIPEKIEKIVALGSGGPRYAAYLGVMDMLVGAEDHDAEEINVRRDYNPIYQEMLKDLPRVGAGGGSGANNGYPEEIINVSPDVILAGMGAEAADELQGQTGIPVVSIRYTSKGLANETFYDSLKIFAEVVGKTERAEELLAYIDELKADLNSRTEGILEEDKPSVYSGAVTFSGRHGFTGTYSKFGPFDAVNAKNVADNEKEEGYYETDFEQVLNWNPDMIFLDPGNMDMVNDEYNSNPTYFNSIPAIKEGRVYTMPAFNNCGMNVTYALMDAYYAGITMFPEEFNDIKIEEKSAEILETFLGENTFDLMKENGLYYGQIKIGE